MIGRSAIALTIKDLSVAYNKEYVLKNINLSIPKGKLIAVIGPNGAGKTTLMKTILNIVKPNTGSVLFPSLSTKKWNNEISYVPQNGSVDWDFPITVLEVVLMGRYGYLGWFKKIGTKEKEMAFEMLEKVGMKEFHNRQIGQLSGGQQQRVFLARALVQNAQIYLLDEPFKGVDVKTEEIIVRLLKELRNKGKTVIVVHHNLDTVEDYFDWSILINREVIASGPVKEVFNKENLHVAYHGSEITFVKAS